MSRVVRIALTETINAYPHMPERLEDLGQLQGRLDELRQANLEHHAALAAAAASAGAHLLVCGELFAGPYFALEENPMWLDLAEHARTGPSVMAMRRCARDHQLVIVAPIYELGEDGQRFNTAVVIDERGEILGKYRKCHIPYGQNEQASFTEGFYYVPSDGRLGDAPANISSNDYFPVFDTSAGKLAVAICYDRHFAGVMDTYADEGAELVVSPAVTFGAKSRRMWHLEFPVDALRHNLFIAGSNRRGVEKPWNQPYFGESYVCGPNGVCPVKRGVHPDLVVTDVDLDELSAPDPSGWNLQRDRRPDLYNKRSRRGEPRELRSLPGRSGR